MIKGFSTGALAKGDFKQAIKMLKGTTANAVELSALREWETEILIDAIDELDLSQFKYVSFHAPSKLMQMGEAQLLILLENVAARKMNIIVHPDIITDYRIWRRLGSFLCIENMDKRKKLGQTYTSLKRIFDDLPEASFCFDIGHAAQVDSSMEESARILKNLKGRLKQIHISSVNEFSYHENINKKSLLCFSKVASLIPYDMPLIIESQVDENNIESEMDLAALLFDEKFRKETKIPISINF